MIVLFNADEIPYYNSVEEFLREEDLIEVDVYIVGMGGKFRIRALTFDQMTRITQKSTKDGNIDHGLFVINTWKEGVVRPIFNDQQLQMLYGKNAEIVKEVSDQIWAAGRVTKRTFDEYIAELQRTAEVAKTESRE